MESPTELDFASEDETGKVTIESVQNTEDSSDYGNFTEGQIVEDGDETIAGESNQPFEDFPDTEDLADQILPDFPEEIEESETRVANPQVGNDDHRVKLLQLPVGRIKSIIKSDPDVNLINQDAVFLITRATELFIDSLAKESYKYTVQAKKKTMQKNDVHSAIDNVEALVFLDGMLK